MLLQPALAILVDNDNLPLSVAKNIELCGKPLHTKIAYVNQLAKLKHQDMKSNNYTVNV